MTEPLIVNNATVAHYELKSSFADCYELARVAQSDGAQIKIVVPAKFSWGSGCSIEDEDFYVLVKKEPAAWNDFFKAGRRGSVKDIRWLNTIADYHHLLTNYGSEDCWEYSDGRKFLNDIHAGIANRLAQLLEKPIIENRVCLQKENEYFFLSHLQFSPSASEASGEGTWKIKFVSVGNRPGIVESVSVSDLPFVSGFVVYSSASIPESLRDLIDQIPECQ